MRTAILFVSGCLALNAFAEANWPSWRGAQGRGAAEEEGPVVDEPLWKVELPGRGCSTPVVWDERIYVTAPIGEEDGLITYDLEGKELWRKSFGELTPGRGQRVGSSANSSPLTDGEKVFAYFKSGHFAALTVEGEELWSFNVFERYGKNHLWWDVGTSPVLAGGNVVLAVLQTEGDSFLVSLDMDSGEEVWRTEREFETGRESGDAYTTPLVREVDGVETIITWGADHLTGHGAESGELLWTCGGFNPEKEGAWRVIASAVETDGMVVVPYARGAMLAGVKLGGEGDITDSALLWKKSLGSDSATPVAKDGRVYVLGDMGRTRGTVSCVSAADGEILWSEKLPRAPQVFYASPVIAGDRFYCLREDGMLFQAKLGEGGLEDLKETALGENTIASPVPVGGKLLVRGDKHLMCFGE